MKRYQSGISYRDHGRPSLVIDQDGRTLGRIGPAPTGNLPALRNAVSFAAAARAAPATRGLSLVAWGLRTAARNPYARAALRRAARALGRWIGQTLRAFGLYGQEGAPATTYEENLLANGWTEQVNSCNIQNGLNINATPRICNSLGTTTLATWAAGEGQMSYSAAFGGQYSARFYNTAVDGTGIFLGTKRWLHGSVWIKNGVGANTTANHDAHVAEISPTPEQPDTKRAIYISAITPYDRDNWLPSMFPDLLRPNTSYPVPAPVPVRFPPPRIPLETLPSDQQRWRSRRYASVPQGGIVSPSYAPNETPLEHDTIVIASPSDHGAGMPPPPRVHVNAPPKWNEKERKAKVHRIMAVALNIGGKLTEGADVVDALYDALPNNLKIKFRDTNYNLQSATPQAKLKQLWEHWDKVDIDAALGNLAKNEIEDFIIGKAGQYGKKWAKASGRPTSSLTALGKGNYGRMVARTQARR